MWLLTGQVFARITRGGVQLFSFKPSNRAANAQEAFAMRMTAAAS
jgi:hypothetical protein